MAAAGRCSPADSQVGRGLWAWHMGRGPKASRPRAVERGASGCGQGAQRPASSVRSGRPAQEQKVLGSPRPLRVLVILRERLQGHREGTPLAGAALLAGSLAPGALDVARVGKCSPCKLFRCPGQGQFPGSFGAQLVRRGLRALCVAFQFQASLTCLGH